MRILLVVNSFASSVTARNTVIVHRALSRHHDVQIVETNRRGHATRFAQDAAHREVDLVISFGGDGTLNEVASGVAGSQTSLGVLPGGSTNVFARTIGLPNDPIAAVNMLVSGLEDPQANIRPIGLGRVNGRFFCFHTGVGYDAAVVRNVETRASLKRWAGHPLFIYAAIQTWLNKYDRHHPHFTVAADAAIGGPGSISGSDINTYDPQRFVDDGYFTVVLNTNPYSFLGNRALDLSPAAGLDKPLVAVTFRTMSAIAIIRTLAGALKGGGVTPSEHVACFNDVHELIIENATPFPYQVDGDYLGESTRLHFRHVPEAVRLLFPA
ncbi:MAG: diacylglycerol kinase family protein [Actinobacteria bacterium]|nr:diacylglycerol kinase family protein [Actinomycetota bacterium]